MFASASGKPKGYRNARRALKIVGDKLGFDLVQHDFRRKVASFMIVARADEAAGDWREAEQRNAIVLRQLADAGIGQ